MKTICILQVHMVKPILRRLKENTIFLILLITYSGKNNTPKVISKKTDMTLQGALQYVKEMNKMGLVEYENRRIKITMKGIQYMQDYHKEFTNFIKNVGLDLNIIDKCSAVAEEDIKHGDKVHLFMQGGIMTAYKTKHSLSYGIAVTDSKKGEVVVISNLRGLLKFPYGTVYVVRIYYGLKENGDKLKEFMNKNNIKIAGVEGIEALWYCKKFHINTDISFGAIHGVIDAAIRGLDVIFFVSGLEFSDIMNEFKKACDKYPVLNIKNIDITDI